MARILAEALRRDYPSDRLIVIENDILKVDLASIAPSLGHPPSTRLVVVGNLPYNISTPLLFHLLEQADVIRDMHFMLQKEVVDRMAAAPGSKAYGRLGIMLGCYLQIEALLDVPPEAFTPPPEVNSAVVRLDPLPPGTFQIDNEAALSALVAKAFMQRRKTLRNALRDVVAAEDFDAVGIDPGLRPEQLPIADYVRLGNYLERNSR